MLEPMSPAEISERAKSRLEELQNELEACTRPASR